METEILKIVVSQGIFAVLFVWLFFDTRKDSKQREEKYINTIDKLTDKKLLSFYPGMDWKGVMGMRDIIAHHYFDLDAEIVYDVIKHDLPKLKDVLQQIVDDLKVSNQAID